LVRWDRERPGNIRPFVERINRIRKENAALRLYRNLRFHRADNDRVIFYGKSTPDRSNQILIAVSLDPHSPQDALLEVPLSELGIGPDETYQVHELLRGERALWKGAHAQVSLTPNQPAAIWSVLRFSRRENQFDYYFLAGAFDYEVSAGSMIEKNPLLSKRAIIYEVHIRVFLDSNDDGIGDIQGLIQKLPYLEGLGVTCLWLLPMYPSPLRDDGYDISDYCNIHPDYGTLEDFRQLVEEA